MFNFGKKNKNKESQQAERGQQLSPQNFIVHTMKDDMRIKQEKNLTSQEAADQELSAPQESTEASPFLAAETPTAPIAKSSNPFFDQEDEAPSFLDTAQSKATTSVQSVVDAPDQSVAPTSTAPVSAPAQLASDTPAQDAASFPAGSSTQPEGGVPQSDTMPNMHMNSQQSGVHVPPSGSLPEQKLPDFTGASAAHTTLSQDIATESSPGISGSPTSFSGSVNSAFGDNGHDDELHLNADTLGPSEGEDLHITEKPSIFKRIFTSLAILVLLALIGVGLYVLWTWWQGNVQTDDMQGNADGQEIVQEGDGGEIVDDEFYIPNPEAVQYSADLPNYITLSSVNADGASALETQMGIIRANLSEQDISAPISFIVVNENEAPYSFRAFAQRTNLTFPQEILDLSGEQFEIFAYKDLGDVRFGLAFDAEDEALMRERMLAREGELPLVMESFLPPGLYVEEFKPFADNIYGSYPVRYTNLTEQNIESIDYSVGNERVFIGTTLKTLRAILEWQNANDGIAVTEEVASEQKEVDEVNLEDDLESERVDDGSDEEGSILDLSL